MSSSIPERGTDEQLDPDQRAAADPLGMASQLDAGEEDPDAGATADLPGHGVDEVLEDPSSGPVQEPSIGPPSQDHR